MVSLLCSRGLRMRWRLRGRHRRRSLRAGVRVRMGVHTGDVALTEIGYVGMEVHRAARIMAAGHGGQVLVSETTAALRDGARLRDLGPHRLKDMLQPIRLYQLEVDGLPVEFPPLRSLHQTNLPVAAWPLLGREPELGVIRKLVAGNARLVTLTGAGGSGKTRLALQAAAELSDQFTDGVFFVGLAPLRDTSTVLPTVAEAVGLQPDDDLVGWLGSKRMLLVLDNLEHLPEVASVVSELLVGETTIVATSRTPLHLTVERELPVDPLPDDAAVELFVSRAAAAGREVAADETVAAVCRRLDNLPLALELAAARAKLLSPSALLQRLDAALPLLTGGASDRPERQRTLRATIEWSHDLLEVDAKAAFRRLSVFRGSFTLEAGEEIAGADLDQVAALLDQSLLKPLGDDRFFMLETLREYACEQLDAVDETETFALRHTRYYASLCEALLGTTGADRKKVRVAEAPNVQAAIAFADAHDDTELHLRLLTYGGQVCSGRSLPEFRDALAEALRRPTPDLVLRGRAAHRLGFEEYRLGEYAAAQATAELALELGEQSATHDLIAAALDLLGIIAVTEGDFDRARGFHERALALSRAVGDDTGAANALVNLGDAALVAGEYERAIELTSEAIEHERQGAGDLQVPLVNLAAAHIHLGHVTEAEENAAASLAASPELRDPLADAFALRVFAAAAVARRDLERAALLLGAADALDSDLGARTDPSQQALRAKVLGELEATLGAGELLEALARGRSVPAEQAFELALTYRLA